MEPAQMKWSRPRRERQFQPVTNVLSSKKQKTFEILLEMNKKNKYKKSSLT